MITTTPAGDVLNDRLVRIGRVTALKGRMVRIALYKSQDPHFLKDGEALRQSTFHYDEDGGCYRLGHMSITNLEEAAKQPGTPSHIASLLEEAAWRRA